MAPRLFARPRANTTQISRPTLQYTDALPRNDLQDLGTLSSLNRPTVEVTVEAQRPKTAHSPSARDSQKNHALGFDFGLTESRDLPPTPINNDDAFPQSSNAMIGVAIGSPGMAPPYMMVDDWPLPNAPHDMSHDMRAELRRKPSKWKKIGSLFKAKQEAGRTDDMTQYGRSETPDYQRVREPSQRRPSTQHGRQRAAGGYLRDDPPPRFPMPENSRGLDDRRGALLEVEIPKIEMERYSVMFESVLGNKQQPGLLARRSRTLDNLVVPEKEFEKLEITKPKRRATSPVTMRPPNDPNSPTPSNSSSPRSSWRTATPPPPISKFPEPEPLTRSATNASGSNTHYAERRDSVDFDLPIESNQTPRPTELDYRNKELPTRAPSESAESCASASSKSTPATTPEQELVDDSLKVAPLRIIPRDARKEKPTPPIPVATTTTTITAASTSSNTSSMKLKKSQQPLPPPPPPPAERKKLSRDAHTRSPERNRKPRPKLVQTTKEEDPQDDKESIASPQFEITVARSVSFSRRGAPRQTLVSRKGSVNSTRAAATTTNHLAMHRPRPSEPAVLSGDQSAAMLPATVYKPPVDLA